VPTRSLAVGHDLLARRPRHPAAARRRTCAPAPAGRLRRAAPSRRRASGGPSTTTSAPCGLPRRPARHTASAPHHGPPVRRQSSPICTPGPASTPRPTGSWSWRPSLPSTAPESSIRSSGPYQVIRGRPGSRAPSARTSATSQGCFHAVRLERVSPREVALRLASGTLTSRNNTRVARPQPLSPRRRRHHGSGWRPGPSRGGSVRIGAWVG